MLEEFASLSSDPEYRHRLRKFAVQLNKSSDDGQAAVDCDPLLRDIKQAVRSLFHNLRRLAGVVRGAQVVLDQVVEELGAFVFKQGLKITTSGDLTRILVAEEQVLFLRLWSGAPFICFQVRTSLATLGNITQSLEALAVEVGIPGCLRA